MAAIYSHNNFMVWFDLVLHFFCFMYFYILHFNH